MRSSRIKQSKRLMGAAALWIIAAAIPVFAFGAEQQSAELSITPVVIDEKGQARDILKESITLVNTSERKLTLYPSVNNVDSADGKQEFVSARDSTDRAASLANWIELSRGVVELGPGEEKVIPFVIRINMNAVSGEYHARISFGNGSSRSAAEGSPPLATLMVNLEVKQDVKEVMQLNKFFTDNFYFSGDDVLFNYQLENIGNQELQPRGEIRIYNRRGEEVASVGVNKDGKSYAPDQVAQLASVWNATDGFGRYKAFITIDYGKGQGASVQDTIYFWIIPWKQLLALLIVSIIAVIFFALYFHKWFEDRHLGKLALAGMLKHPAHVAAQPVSSSAPARPGVVARTASQLGTTGRFVASYIPTISFSRRAPVAPTSAAVAPTPQHTAPTSAATPPARPQRSLRDAFESEGSEPTPSFVRPITNSMVDRGGTIDLKKLHQERAGTVRTEGHVINLKRK